MAFTPQRVKIHGNMWPRVKSIVPEGSKNSSCYVFLSERELDCACSAFRLWFKMCFCWLYCLKCLTVSGLSPYSWRQSYPCALWLSFIQPQFTETNHRNSEHCRHRFSEFEIVHRRPPPSSVSAPLPLKCVCLIASESLHWPESNFQNYK